ncbi:MAG: hypothetical protein NTX56_18730, partial [Proteobacteria bacterium]|nr:hypothetical protein [Pseudomonadota bacterium]
MRDLLTTLDQLNEATLSAGQIIKYPERFEAFISHIKNGKPFYTEADGTEVILKKSEANRFLQLNNQGMFKGNLKGLDTSGQEWPLSVFRKTAEFGGASAKPGEEGHEEGNKEGILVKPGQIQITDKAIPAHKLLKEITTNQVLASTEYGRAVIQMASSIALGEPAVIPLEYIKNDSVKKAIVDYAGEYLGVLALIMNQTDFPKRDEFLAWLETDISSLVINFPSASNNPIADSFATVANPANDRQLNISSKGTGGGAAPSVSGLVVPDNVRKKKAYKTAVDIIDICQNKNLPSPASISQVFQVMNLLNERLPDEIPDEFKSFLPWDKAIVTQIRDSIKQHTKMPHYRKLFANVVSAGDDGGKLNYVTKKAVMDIINSGAVPEFQAAVLEILDYNFVQQYTTVNNKTGVLKFVTQWPAKLDGKVSIETKSSGTDPTKGGFSFKLKPKGAAKSELAPPDATEVDKETKSKVE